MNTIFFSNGQSLGTATITSGKSSATIPFGWGKPPAGKNIIIV